MKLNYYIDDPVEIYEYDVHLKFRIIGSEKNTTHLQMDPQFLTSIIRSGQYDVDVASKEIIHSKDKADVRIETAIPYRIGFIEENVMSKVWIDRKAKSLS